MWNNKRLLMQLK